MPATAVASADSIVVVRMQLPRLRAARERAGFSLRQLEKFSGVPFRKIWQVAVATAKVT